MGPFSNKNKTDPSAVNQEVDPMYNNEAGPGNFQAGGGQLAGHYIPGNQQAQTGLGAGGGGLHNVNAGAGSNLGPSDPTYNNSVGTNDPTHNNNRSAVTRGAEGAALGGVAGHHGHHGHTARDAALVGAGGAALQHEHNKHHNQSSNMAGVGAGPVAGDGYNNTVGGTGAGTGAGVYNDGTGTGMGTHNDGTGTGAGAYNDGTGTGEGAYNDGTGLAPSGGGRRMGVGSNQPDSAGTMPDLNQAKKLDRSGKLDKVVGTLTGSTKLKQEGLQKRADAAAIRQQTQHLNVAQDLEAQAQMRRAHAVGLGAHPKNVAASGQTQGF